MVGLGLSAGAQEHIPSKVDIAWNRYYTYEQLEGHLKRIAGAYPQIVELVDIGKSREGRTMWVAIVNSPKTGPHTSKPAMWIDGNVHGNEIQAAEAVVYSVWYLAKAYGKNAQLTELMDSTSFYFLPSQNPDGREHWFAAANTPHSSRHSVRPKDNDLDGEFDEDPPDDLDGDGSITTMWQRDPNGDWIRDRNDPRIFRRVASDEKGEWTRLGSEGIDNDGDGRINEDGLGGDDMNRDWPSGWLPPFVQWAAGEFPLSSPETMSIAQFIQAHPNIGAGQSYHNTGGMILRGPGASFRESYYPRSDRQVYDEIGELGEDLLPYYNYWVIHQDLYTVHGGFVNWLAEGLGAISFTNELMASGRYFQRDETRPGSDKMWIFYDHLQFGEVFKEYEEYDHPQYGRVLIGGLNKWSSRVTPTFMLEEECHRNFSFTMFHASHLPKLKFGKVDVQPEGGRLWSITFEIHNEHLIPTRTAVQRERGIGRHDLLFIEPQGQGRVVTSGRLSSWRDDRMSEIRFEPNRIQLDGGIGSRDNVIFRVFVEGDAGEDVRLSYQAERAADVDMVVTLEAPEGE